MQVSTAFLSMCCVKLLNVFLEEDSLFTTQTENETVTFMMPCL
jgi:hypothetical protein